MKELKAYEYLLAQLGGELGFDKATWDIRLQEGIKYYKLWCTGKVPLLKPDDQVLLSYLIGLDNFRQGKPVHTPVRLDWGSSGPSLLSAVFRDEVGMRTTGALSQKPGDLYHSLAEAVGIHDSALVKRFKKKVTLPYIYGGDLGVRECLPSILGCSEKEATEIYSNAYKTLLPGAYHARLAFLNAWDETKSRYCWILPDGFEARVIITNQVKHTLEIVTASGNKYSTSIIFDVETAKVKGEDGTKCLGAHSVQSLDAYVLRELLRRSSPTRLKKALSRCKPTDGEIQAEGQYKSCLDAWRLTGVLSYACLEYLPKSGLIPTELYQTLKANLDKLPTEDFQVIPIHDEFGVLPDQVNNLRKTCNAIYADIYAGKLLDYWCSIRGTKFTQEVAKVKGEYRQEVYNALLESDYLIC